MSDARTYLRFYYPEFQRDYPEVYADDALFAAWMRLLSSAEATWPVAPELPRWLKPKVQASLEGHELLCVTGSTYALKGFTAERSRRHDAARKAAAVRWHSDGNADA